MKKIISVVSALAIMLTMLTFGTVDVFAEEKQTAEERLAEIQQMNGFVPGETAIVTGNCFRFVCEICEELYGVTYYQEIMYSGYKVKHDTGRFYTVSTLETGSVSEETMESIKNFFVENALPGDIVHYASLSSGYNTHTMMVQSVDDEKITFFHTNWSSDDMSWSAARTDTVYWNSLINNPEQSGSESFNYLFTSKMGNGGIGITINRFSDYEKLFALPETEDSSRLNSSTGIRSSHNELLASPDEKCNLNDGVPVDLQLQQTIA